MLSSWQGLSSSTLSLRLLVWCILLLQVCTCVSVCMCVFWLNAWLSTSILHLSKSQWLIPSHCTPSIQWFIDLKRAPYLPWEINSDFNCTDVSDSLQPTRPNFCPHRCQMALNISANHCRSRGELKETGQASYLRFRNGIKRNQRFLFSTQY